MNPAYYKTVLALALTALALASGLATAQSERVLRESEVTEQALIESLAPDAPAGEPRTRGFVLKKGAPKSDAAPAPRPAASLLITFDTNSTQLTGSARNAIDVVARAMQSEKLAPHKFVVEGHADPRGAPELNEKLSAGRAEAVVSYLVETRGIARDRLSAVGKGSSELANRANPAAPENRRVTIVTVKQ